MHACESSDIVEANDVRARGANRDRKRELHAPEQRTSAVGPRARQEMMFRLEIRATSSPGPTTTSARFLNLMCAGEDNEATSSPRPEKTNWPVIVRARPANSVSENRATISKPSRAPTTGSRNVTQPKLEVNVEVSLHRCCWADFD